MSTSTRNRVRAGVTTGGQFATQAKSEPAVSLSPGAAPHRPLTTAKELAKAQADRERLAKKTAKATRRAATFELANGARIVLEQSSDSTDLVLRKEPGPDDTMKLSCVAVFDADHENPVEPVRWWSETRGRDVRRRLGVWVLICHSYVRAATRWPLVSTIIF